MELFPSLFGFYTKCTILSKIIMYVCMNYEGWYNYCNYIITKIIKYFIKYFPNTVWVFLLFARNNLLNYYYKHFMNNAKVLSWKWQGWRGTNGCQNQIRLDVRGYSSRFSDITGMKKKTLKHLATFAFFQYPIFFEQEIRKLKK